MFWSNPGSKDGVTCKLPVVRGESACTLCPVPGVPRLHMPPGQPGSPADGRAAPTARSLEHVHTLEVLLHSGKVCLWLPHPSRPPSPPGDQEGLFGHTLCRPPTSVGGSVVWLTNSRCLSDSPEIRQTLLSA